MYKFSEKALTLLRKAGWSQNWEATHFSEYQKILTEEKFELSDAVTLFLKRFGGLLVKHPHAKLPSETEYFHFDVTKAVKGVDSDWVKDDYSERVGQPLCIIGEAFNRYMVLAMSPDGEVYAGFDSTLVHVGQSGEEAIENLCSGRELEKIPELTASIEVTVEMLNHFFENERVQKTYGFLNAQGNESIRQHWLEAEFANFIYEHYDGLKWQNSPQTPSDIFNFAFVATGKHYAIDIKQHQLTHFCLNNMITDWGVFNTQDTSSLNNRILAVIGVHPQADMQISEINRYMLTAAQKEGFEINKNNIKTTFIPNTDFAFTISAIER